MLQVFLCGNGSAMRQRWRKNTTGLQRWQQDGHTAADQIPVCWNLDWNWTPFYIHIFDILYSQFRLASGNVCGFNIHCHCKLKTRIQIEIYLLTTTGLTSGARSTAHIYTKTIYRTTQLIWEEYGPCPAFASYTLAFALQLRKKHGKPSVRVAEECQLARWKQYIHNKNT